MQTASASGYIGPDDGFQTHAVGRDSFIGGIVGHGANLITVTGSGEISWVRLPRQENDESTRLLSPSRKFAHTQKHGWPPGAVDCHERKTQFAGAADVFPKFSPAPAEARHNEIGWLRWDP